MQAYVSPLKNINHSSKGEAILQRKRISERAAVDGKAPAIVHEVLRSPGQQVDAQMRSFMESRFGHDFSRVRVHTDAKAEESARAVSAHAYTVGQDIVLTSRFSDPRTIGGQRLLAHELTHVVQQAGQLDIVKNSIVLGETDSHLEREANQVAQTISSGELIRQPVQSHSPTKLQRGFGELRVAEARMQEESLVSNLPVDGEFWILPPGVERDVEPVFDEEDTQVVVAFRTRGSVTKIFDLEGKLISISEPPLETPLLDPIDLLAGGLTSLGRGILGGGARSTIRGTAVRGAATGLSRAGVSLTIRMLGQHVTTAARGAYRAIRFRGLLNFTATTAARMADPTRRVPHHILKLAIRFGSRSPDPQGVAGAFRYMIPMVRNGQTYTLEVIIREADQTVLHFLYR